MIQKEIAFEKLIQIKPEIFLLSDKPRQKPILHMKFSGVYQIGGAGGPDAEFMLAILEKAIEKSRPRGVILDFSELNYQWGDEMLWFLPYEGGGRWGLPTALVIGPKCEEALKSLEFARSKKDLDSMSWSKRSVEEASEFLLEGRSGVN